MITNQFMTIDCTNMFSWFIRADHPKYLLLCDYCITLLCRLDLCYTFSSLLSRCYSLSIITCHYSYSSCILFTNYALVLAVYFVYWCIGIESYPTEETGEGQTFPAFEPIDEHEWSVGYGIGAIWVWAGDFDIISFFVYLNFIIHFI